MSSSTLSFAVRPRVILKYLGQLSLVLAGITLVPYVVSLFFGDFDVSFRYGVVLAGLGTVGYLLRKLPEPSYIQPNEAMVLVALVFLITPLIMAYPMAASGISFEDALFEAVSAGTTTGLSTLSSVEDKPQTFLFARAWMQWYGGLGIVIFALALLIRPGRLTKGFSAAEDIGDDLVGGTRAHARYVLMAYGAMTAVGFVLLLLCGIGAFNSLLYTFAAVSTGGFAPHDASLAGVPGWPCRYVVILLCLAGSLSFVFYRQLYRRGPSVIVHDLQTQAVLVVCLVTTVAVGISMWSSEWGSLADVVSHAPLIGISAQTTAGFSSLDLAELDASTKLILILSMTVGGGLGSTAGGFKVLRLLIALRLISLLIERTAMPAQAVTQPRLGTEKLGDYEIQQTMCLILVFVAAIVLSWVPFVACGYDPLDSLFEVVSATGTVGLSVGITGPDLPPLLKRILWIDMLMGRLEIIAWLVLIYPRTWLGRRRDVK